MLQSPEEKRRAKLQSKTLPPVPKVNEISEMISSIDLRQDDKNNEKEKEKGDASGSIITRIKSQKDKRKGKEKSNTTDNLTTPTASSPRKEWRKSLLAQKPNKRHFGTLQFDMRSPFSSRKSHTSQFDDSNLNYARARMQELDKTFISILELKNASLVTIEDNQPKVPNLTNLEEIFACLCLRLQPELNSTNHILSDKEPELNPTKPLFSDENPLLLREILTGMFVNFDSTSMIETLTVLYPKLNQNEKLNAIFIVKEIIQLDDFYHGSLIRDFRNKVQAFADLMRYGNNGANRDLCVHLSQVLSSKRLLSQPMDPEQFSVDTAIARSFSKKKLLDINELLLKKGSIKKSARKLAHDLTAITLAYFNSIPILEFGMTGSIDKTPCITSFTQTFEKITNFLTAKILNTKSLEERKILVTLIILTIHNLLRSKKLPDFNSAFFLQSILLAGNVERLDKDFTYLDKDVLRIWDKINKALQRRANAQRVSRLISENRVYLPIIPNMIGMCVNIRANNKVWPAKFSVLGSKFVDFANLQERLRGISLTFKTNLHASLETWQIIDADTQHLMSLDLKPKSLFLPEFQYPIVNVFMLTRILEVYAKNKYPLNITYKVFPIVGNDNVYELKNADDDVAIVIFYQWLNNLLSQKAINSDDALALFIQAGKFVDFSEAFMSCKAELENVIRTQFQEIVEEDDEYIQQHKSHLKQYKKARPARDEKEEPEQDSDVEDDYKRIRRPE